jgi:hypothetical protein
MALNLGKKKGSEGSKFKYKPLTSEQLNRQATRRVGGGGDSAVRSDINLFQPKAGDHEIRIMPPTWEDAQHFGLDVWVHYAIGPDGSTYVCMKKMKGEECACCNARIQASKDGEDDLAKDLSPSLRIGYWLINRKEENRGPLVWLAPPKKVNQEIVLQAKDKKTGGFINLEDPEKGYDIEFTVTGQLLNTDYIGIKASRSSSPLSDDEDQMETWLEYIAENPLPDILVYQEYDHVAKQLEGGVRVMDKKKEEEPAAKPKTGKPSVKPKVKKEEPPEEEEEEAVEEEEEEQGGGKIFDTTGMTWELVHDLDEEDTEKLIKAAKIKEKDFSECTDLSGYHDIICARLGLRAGKKGKKVEEEEGEEGESWHDKFEKLKKKRAEK